jgi:ubiquinone biosynthesis protein UbiJ
MKRMLEKALNRYLALDPESKSRLEILQGKVVTLELRGINLTFQLVFSADQVHVNWKDFVKADTVISGSPLTLLRMSFAEGNRKQFFAEEASIEGNLDLGQHVIDLFDQLEIDWEEYLSKVVGDVPAHQIGRFAKRIKKVSRRFSDAMCHDLNQYIHEEIEIFPPAEALNDFYHDVDAVRMDVDRIAARIAHLKQMHQKRDDE